MEIKTLLNHYQIVPQKSRRTEYGDLLDLFLPKLNEGRAERKLPLLTHARLARMLKKGGVSQTYLYAFYKECERANNFSAFFWWKLKQYAAHNK